jgi:hypothetical protein
MGQMSHRAGKADLHAWGGIPLWKMKGSVNIFIYEFKPRIFYESIMIYLYQID